MATGTHTPSITGSLTEGYQQGRNPDGSIAGAAGGIVGQVQEKAEKGAGFVSSAVNNPPAVGGKVKGFFDDVNIGAILGGLLGIGGAMIGGGFFDGWMGTLITVALAVPLMLMGSDKIGGMINGWLGRANNPTQEQVRTPEIVRGQSQAQGQDQGQGQAQDQGKTQAETPPPGAAAVATRTVLTENDMNAMLRSASNRQMNVTSITMVNDNGTVRPTIPGVTPDVAGARKQVPVQQLRDMMDTCKAQGGSGALDLAIGAADRISPTCVPKAAPVASQGRTS